MYSTSRLSQTRTLNERLLITKIITGLGLALMVMVGSWSGTHDGTERSFPAAAHVVEMEQHQSSSAADDSAVAAAWVTAADDVLLAAAGCVLGILCVLVLCAVLRNFVLRSSPRIVQVSPRTGASLAVSARFFAPTLSLIELSLSRT